MQQFDKQVLNIRQHNWLLTLRGRRINFCMLRKVSNIISIRMQATVIHYMLKRKSNWNKNQASYLEKNNAQIENKCWWSNFSDLKNECHMAFGTRFFLELLVSSSLPNCKTKMHFQVRNNYNDRSSWSTVVLYLQLPYADLLFPSFISQSNRFIFSST